MDIYKVLIDVDYILKWYDNNTVIKAIPIKTMPLEDRKEEFVKRLTR